MMQLMGAFRDLANTHKDMRNVTLWKHFIGLNFSSTHENELL